MTAIAITAVITSLLVVLAMNFVTAEKKLTRRIAHKFDTSDPQFIREMSVILGPSVLGGNKIQDLQNGAQIFPEMLNAIASARHTVTFETFIYWSGDIGRKFSDALSNRARAGVQVHVTIDWVGSLPMDEALLDEMRDAGVHVQRYRPLRWYNLGRLNNRTHRKLLVVDGKIGFTGGVGIADQWQGNAEDEAHWRDVHFKVEGPVVGQVQAAFNDNWIRSTGEVLHGPEFFPAIEEVGDTAAQLFVGSPSGGSESMHLMVLMAIASAAESIDIAAAYFVPDSLVLQALVSACRRGVVVRLMVPGKHIDSLAVRLASKAQWGELLKAGALIYEFRRTMMHSKVLIVDKLLVSVGSTNFDMRSFRLNDEASLNVYDRAFGRRMTDVFEADAAEAQRYTLQMWLARPFIVKLGEWLVWPFRSQL